jgi:hypothetical protein
VEPPSKDVSLKFGQFIAHVYDIYFPFDREYGGDLSLEHPLSTADEDLTSDADKGKKPPDLTQ